jgi:hypothetical protein
VIEQPLTVRVIESPRQAFHHHFELVFGTDLLAAETFTVPAGKQLVLTYASASVRRVGVKVSFAIQVLSGTGFVRATHQLVPAAAGPVIVSVGGPQEAIVASEPLHLYVDAGQTVVGRAIRDDSGGLLNGDIDVSGYLVDVPQ